MTSGQAGGPAIHPIRQTLRYYLVRIIVSVLTRGFFRVSLEGRERLSDGPAIYCFNHLSWSDPFMLMAILPFRPRLFFFGPKEEDMRVGGRNRVMHWTGTAIPYKPGKNDLLHVTRRVDAVIHDGAVVAIAGEGRIHSGERDLLPLSDGAAYFALRSGVPLVPMAINGTSWLRFGGRVRVRVGEALPVTGRPTRVAIGRLTDQVTASLLAMTADAPDVEPSGRVGRWLTERFNDWPEGSREAAIAAAGSAEAEAVRSLPATGAEPVATGPEDR